MRLGTARKVGMGGDGLARGGLSVWAGAAREGKSGSGGFGVARNVDNGPGWVALAREVGVWGVGVTREVE